MEDAATAEISRAQLWQWVHLDATLEDGRKVTEELYREMREQEIEALGGRGRGEWARRRRFRMAWVLSREFVPFLTS